MNKICIHEIKNVLQKSTGNGNTFQHKYCYHHPQYFFSKLLMTVATTFHKYCHQPQQRSVWSWGTINKWTKYSQTVLNVNNINIWWKQRRPSDHLAGQTGQSSRLPGYRDREQQHPCRVRSFLWRCRNERTFLFSYSVSACPANSHHVIICHLTN